MKLIKYTLLLLLITSCGTVVNYDYEISTDFTQYKTYNYFDDMKTGLSALDNKRLIRAIDSKLALMGLTRTDNADFYIDIQSQEIQNRNNSNVGVGVGGGNGGGFGGVSVGVPIGSSQNSREIVIDFVDKRNGEKLFWQAVSESTYKPNSSPEEREANFVALIEKILAGYPPKK
ncbi:MAG: DUF4136 domain-containing protein [Winogradskyella sp.]|nr:DUF4136 domain-containing protein [Winogradskyella sp.]